MLCSQLQQLPELGLILHGSPPSFILKQGTSAKVSRCDFHQVTVKVNSCARVLPDTTISTMMVYVLPLS